ncbi:protein saal1-like [Vespa mandarinia]|uniref:protein saal1-like n=1 Tax=Vespa mandarinia TaxID=7446 RepID=UPI001617BDE1|nr:protein saal1-like [Vespa mandarinia]
MNEDNSSKNVSDSDSVNYSVMLDSGQFDNKELGTMRGDSIGDTVYSAKWIINTLISLSKVQDVGWTQELENDLCILWDMTAEKDIAMYLYENDFLKIVEASLETSTVSRLTEILLGIIGNMSCQTSILKSMGNNKQLVKTIWNNLLSDDTESLLQIFRLLQAVVWDIQRNPESQWVKNIKECDFFSDVVIFVLNSSTNNDLLVTTLNLLLSISQLSDTNFLLELFNTEKLVSALLECFMQVIPQQKYLFSEAELKIIEKWLTVLSTVVKFQQITANNKNNKDIMKLMEIIFKILQPYKHKSNLIPIDENSALCIQECIEIILYIQKTKTCIIPEINSIIINIICKLKSAEQDEFRTYLDDITIELIDYLERYWVEMLEIYTTDHIKDILCICNKQIANSFVEFIKLRPNVSQFKLEKLLEAHSCLS